MLFSKFSICGKCLLPAAFLLFSLFSCQKDRSEPAVVQPALALLVAPNYPISLAEAMLFFSTAQSTIVNQFGDNQAFIEMAPDWSHAVAGQSLTGRDVITVPLPDSAMHAYNDGRVGAKLQFSKTGQDSIAADLVVYVADSSHHDAVSGQLEFNTFTGVYVYYDIGQNFKYAILVDSGTVVAATDSFSIDQTNPSTTDRCEDYIEATIIYHEYVCVDVAFSPHCEWVKKYLHFWHCAGGGTNEPSGTNPPNNSSGEPGNNNGGGGLGNPNNVNTDYWLNYVQNFSTSFFDPNATIELPEGFTAEQLQQLIELFHQLPLTPAEFHTLLNQVSFVSVIYQAYQQGSDPEWLKEVLAFAAAHGLTAGQLEFLILNEQVYAQVKNLTTTLGLLSEQVRWLIDHDSLMKKLIDPIIAYLNQNGYSAESKDVAIKVMLIIQNTTVGESPSFETTILDWLENDSEYIASKSLNDLITEYNALWFNPPPDTEPLTLPEDFENCFLSATDCPNCTYYVTLYIEQPIPGDRSLSGGTGGSKNGGHTFINLEQNDIGPGGSGFETNMTFGWYPVNKPSGQEEVLGYFYPENEITVYNISLGFSLTRQDFDTVIDILSNNNLMYQTGYNNCSTVMVNALKQVGKDIPTKERRQWPIGTILVNPADLGEDLRDKYSTSNQFFSTTGNTYVTPPLSTCN